MKGQIWTTMAVIALPLFAGGTIFAGGLNGALEGADKEMQSVEEKFVKSLQDKKSAEEKSEIITEDGAVPVNEDVDEDEKRLTEPETPAIIN